MLSVRRKARWPACEGTEGHRSGRNIAGRTGFDSMSMLEIAMTETYPSGFVDERTRRVFARGRRSTVRSAVNAIARHRSVQPRPAVERNAGLQVQWLLGATKCDAAAAALCIRMVPGSAIGRELSIPGYVFRRWLKTTDKVIAALERWRIHGLVSWKKTGDIFRLVPHLH